MKIVMGAVTRDSEQECSNVVLAVVSHADLKNACPVRSHRHVSQRSQRSPIELAMGKTMTAMDGPMSRRWSSQPRAAWAPVCPRENDAVHKEVGQIRVNPRMPSGVMRHVMARIKIVTVSSMNPLWDGRPFVVKEFVSRLVSNVVSRVLLSIRSPASQPLDQRRDRLDQDCDGRIDEAFVATAVTCGDGVCQTIDLNLSKRNGVTEL